MKKTIIILSVFALIAIGYGQTVNAESTESTSSQMDLIKTLNESGSSYTIDTLADGTVKIEIIKSPHIPPYHPRTKKTSSFSDRAEKRLIITVPILIILLIWLSILYFTSIRSSKKARENYLENLQIFKQNADKIFVDLNKCKIKQRTRYEKIIKTDRQQQRDIFDSRIFGIHRSDTKEIHQCTVTYKAKINGTMKTFYSYIDKDELTLRILFAQQETTYIYVNKQDSKDYYFDLEFLNN